MARILSMLVGGLALVGLLTATAMPVLAADYEKSLTVTVDQVRVSRTGGITMSGTLDCTTAVLQMYQGAVPENTTMFVNVDWDASQMVGRNKVIFATYRSGIASICFTNDPVFEGWAGAWQTSFPFPTGGEQWVYSRDGKFSSGPIHVELYVYGGPFAVGEDSYSLYAFAQQDVKAMRSR